MTGLAAVKQGLDSWFFLTADYAFGQDLEKDTTNVVLKSGGKVLGSVRHPLNTSDFSSFLLQAQASKAKVIGLANAGGDTINAHQAGGRVRIDEGRPESCRRCSPSSPISTASVWKPRRGCCFPKPSTGTSTTTPARSPSASWSAIKRVPTSAQAGVYSSVTHYLKAVKAAGTTDFGRRHEDHEGHPDQRHVRQERQDPRRRPHGARHVFVRGQEAVGIQGALGQLQAAGDHPRQRGVPVAGSSRAARW